MPKILKFLLAGILSLGLCYFAYHFYNVFINTHSIDWNVNSNYLWIFNDSIKHDLNIEYACSFVKEKDVCTLFHYKLKNRIIVWEFKDLKITNINDMRIDTAVYLGDVSFNSYEQLFNKGDLDIILRYNFALDKKINVNTDPDSKILSFIEKPNYKGFYGTVNRMSISNMVGEHQILFDFKKGPETVLFLLYKGHSCFYYIMIFSQEPFDESMLNILNLT